MIKTIEQATAVQRRRVAAGLHGYAKAVRRFVRRTHPDEYRRHMSRMDARFPVKQEQNQ